MNDIRVIGIGSPFGNDDIGWRVIEHLQYSKYVSRDIDLVATDRPGIRLLQLLQGAHRVILVDALIASERHGEILVLDQSQIIAPDKMYSSHDMDVAGALQLGAKLKMLPAKLSIVALAIDPNCNQSVEDILIEHTANAVYSELTGSPETARQRYS